MLKALLSRLVVKGDAAVTLPNARRIAIGVRKTTDAGLAIAIHDWRTLWRILRQPALAVGEAYSAQALRGARLGAPRSLRAQGLCR